jgi:hypothetical protein
MKNLSVLKLDIHAKFPNHRDIGFHGMALKKILFSPGTNDETFFTLNDNIKSFARFSTQ